MVVRHQITGNTGLYHVARELSRRQWHVMPTVRNAAGADLYAANDDETVVLPIQSKALSKRNDVGLGASLDKLKSRWWIITLSANSDSPTCYILTLEEVKAHAVKNTNKSGQDSYWLPFRAFTLPAFKEAWERLGSPLQSSLVDAPE